MSRSSKIGAFGPAGCVLLLGVLAAQAQEPAALLEQARPHLEAVLGQPLDRSARVRTAARDEVLTIPDPELALQLTWQFPELQANQFLGTAYRAAKEDNASVAAAMVDPRTGEIYSQPSLGEQIARWNITLARTNSSAFLQLALVQAAAYRYLDHVYSLPRRWQSCRDGEEFQILQSLRAGRALWLTRQVARRLGSETYFPLLVQCYRYVPNQGRDRSLLLVCSEVMSRKFTTATQGLAFCEYLDEQHWPEAEQRMFAQPPRQLAWLTRPELYVRAQQSARTSLTAMLQRVEPALPAAEWDAAQQPWTPDMVRQAAALLRQQAQAERVLRAWNEARMLVWMDKRSAGKQVALSVARFENEAGARAYFGFANDLQRQRDAMRNAPDAGLMRVLDSRTSPASLADAAEAVRFEKKLQFEGADEPMTEKKLLARAGDLVLEIAWYGMDDDMAWAERVVAEMLR